MIEATVRDGITHFQGATWKCNCLAVVRAGEALVVDACWHHRDLERIAGHVRGMSTHLLITHADIDHVCSVPFLPDATVVMGERSAGRIDDGSAAEEIAGEAPKWGLELPTDLRYDVVLEAGAEAGLGPFRVATVEARGHSVDGLGYVLRDEGIFALGDYLMRSMNPLVWWSFREARRTTERLLTALDVFDLELVMPGHGPLLSVGEAREIGAQDLAYMEAVERAADDAHASGASPREWHLAVEQVPVPRPVEPDVAMLCPTLLNTAATFRDRGVEPSLPWTLDMA